MSGAKLFERAEIGPMTSDAAHYRAEPARPLLVPARESSPFTRKCRRLTAQAEIRPFPRGGPRVVTSMRKRSDEAIARRRRSARMRRIDGLRNVAEMVQNPLDDGGLLDAGDHPQLPAALPAGLDIDGEHPPEALCPRHRPLPVADRDFGALGGSGSACPRHNLCRHTTHSTVMNRDRLKRTRRGHFFHFVFRCHFFGSSKQGR